MAHGGRYRQCLDTFALFRRHTETNLTSERDPMRSFCRTSHRRLGTCHSPECCTTEAALSTYLPKECSCSGTGPIKGIAAECRRHSDSGLQLLRHVTLGYDMVMMMMVMMHCLLNAIWTTAGRCCSEEVVNTRKHRNDASQKAKQQCGATKAHVGVKPEQYWPE